MNIFQIISLEKFSILFAEKIIFIHTPRSLRTISRGHDDLPPGEVDHFRSRPFHRIIHVNFPKSITFFCSRKLCGVNLLPIHYIVQREKGYLKLVSIDAKG